MNKVPPDIAPLVRRLVLSETHAPDGVDAMMDAGEGAWNRLEQQLTLLIGPVGFAALTARALALTRPQHPVLADFTYGTVPGARLTGLREAAHAYPAPVILDALVDLIAHFHTVLIRLIGADLVLLLLRQMWPELPPEDLTLSLETHA